MNLPIYYPNAKSLEHYSKHGYLSVSPEISTGEFGGGYEIDIFGLDSEPKYLWIQREHPCAPRVVIGNEKMRNNHSEKRCLGIIHNGRSLKRIRIEAMNLGDGRYGDRIKFIYRDVETFKFVEQE